MGTFVTVRPSQAQPAGPGVDIAAGRGVGGRPLPAPSRAIFWLAVAGVADALFLCYSHLFRAGVCIGGQGCHGVLESAYGRVLGIPLAAFGLGLFVALALAASRRALAWVRLFAVLGALPGPFLVYIQAVRLHEWCPLCLVAVALLVAAAVLSVRGGRAWLDLARTPSYLVALGLPVLLVWGTERGMSERDARRALAPPLGGGSVVIAGETIPVVDIDRAIRTEIARLEWERHRARLAWVESKVLAREAGQQGLAVEDLVRRNVDYKVVIPEAEIADAYRAAGGTEAKVPAERRTALAAELALERRRAVEEEFRRSLFEKHGVVLRLPPPGERAEVAFNNRGGPVTGPADAPVEIVLFSDFSCPACARVHAWLRDVETELGVPVRVAFRHFPFGPPGPAAAMAAAAHEQGRFWPMADALFAARGSIDPARIDDYARGAGLDLPAFHAALASDRPAAALAADADEAEALGVRTAPTLFVNGVQFVGVPDLRLLRAILDR